MCRCGHPAHHHTGTGYCATTTISGPAVIADNHEGRTVTRCECTELAGHL